MNKIDLLITIILDFIIFCAFSVNFGILCFIAIDLNDYFFIVLSMLGIMIISSVYSIKLYRVLNDYKKIK
ncbi:hypothetical protein GCM10008931_40980 [Oceanobacillus oncorhynchi subsp. oncorhynchi]